MSDVLLTEHRDAVLVLTLNRPEARNALSPELIGAISDSLKQAIETKQRAEQESLAMSFRLQKERQEADRKRIEAEGIRDFSRTVAAGISPELLTWKGIEATEKLSDSPNSKIVIIGNSKNGLPLIMGGGGQ